MKNYILLLILLILISCQEDNPVSIINNPPTSKPEIKPSNPEIGILTEYTDSVKIEWIKTENTDNYIIIRDNLKYDSTINTYYLDTNVLPGQSYSYKLQSKNKTGVSNLSQSKSIKLSGPYLRHVIDNPETLRLLPGRWVYSNFRSGTNYYDIWYLWFENDKTNMTITHSFNHYIYISYPERDEYQFEIKISNDTLYYKGVSSINEYGVLKFISEDTLELKEKLVNTYHTKIYTRR